jgi:M6 family metalloprotease-like protein
LVCLGACTDFVATEEFKAAESSSSLFSQTSDWTKQWIRGSAESLNPVITSFEGRAEVTISEDPDLTEAHYQLTLTSADRKSRTVHLTGRPGSDIESGDVVRVEGYQLKDSGEVIADAQSVREVLPKAREELQGEQRTLILLGNFLDTNVAFPTAAEMENIYLRDPLNVDAFYQEDSYGKVYFTGTARGWYTMPMNMPPQSCTYKEKIRESMIAVADAADPDLDFRNYDRLVIIFPTDCERWGGTATNGKTQLETPDGIVEMSTSWFNAAFAGWTKGLAHEMGHNFGLFHGEFLNCHTQSLGGANCEIQTYRDVYSIMGGGLPMMHCNLQQKLELGWLSYDDIFRVMEDGTYAIEPISAPRGGKKGLRIPRKLSDGTTEFFYVEYRQPIGFDAAALIYAESDVYTGALIHVGEFWHERGLETFLVDATVPPEASHLTTALPPGSKLVDPISHTEIETISAMPSELVVRVKLGRLVSRAFDE